MLQKYVPFPPGNQAGIFIRDGFNTEVGPNLDPKCLIMDDLFLQPVNNFSVMSGWVFCVEPVPISLRLKCLVPLLISC